MATDFTGRQLRLMFALSPWDRPMQYGQQAADEMQAKETLFKNFFQNVEVVMRQHSSVHTSKWAVGTLCCPVCAGGKRMVPDACILCMTSLKPLQSPEELCACKS